MQDPSDKTLTGKLTKKTCKSSVRFANETDRFSLEMTI